MSYVTPTPISIFLLSIHTFSPFAPVVKFGCFYRSVAALWATSVFHKLMTLRYANKVLFCLIWKNMGILTDLLAKQL